MSKSIKIIIAAVAIVIIGAVAYVAFYSKPTAAPASSTTNKNVPVAATITYSDSGFSPASTTVKSGQIVAITNNASTGLQFESNPHPAHTDDTDLNVGSVSSGETKTFTVTNKGTFGFHDHFNPSKTANITIQ